MNSIKVFTLTIGLLSALTVVAAAVSNFRGKAWNMLTKIESGNGFAVVELFTSEGCSSCPPADELVEQIQQDNQNKNIYILAFHVDYWDHQGWKDKFGDPEFTKRQRQYVRSMNLKVMYTPQIVVNGTKEYVGSDGNSIINSISEGLKKAPSEQLKLDCRLEGNKVNVAYDFSGDRESTELTLALVQKSATSNVRAGENTGRKLTHVQIVRYLTHVPFDLKNKNEVTVAIPSDLNEQPWEIVGFVQRKSNGQILAADRFDSSAASANVR